MGNKKKSELGVQISLDTDDEWALATGKEVSLQNAAILMRKCTEYIIQEAFAFQERNVSINLNIHMFTVNIQRCHGTSKIDSGPSSKSLLG